MSGITDQFYLLNEQYKDGANFNARVQLHARFSTNKHGWNRWMFDQFQIAPGSRILELGCGPGLLWVSNQHRIPDDWQITLSDFSAGMLQEARQHLSQVQHPFSFQVIDAQAIPFDDASLDVVIANHMLYHVPDRARALSKMRRVLKPDGRLYASTIGETHTQEIYDLASRALGMAPGKRGGFSFTLENGAEQLAQWFASVTLSRYEDALVVTEAEPLIEYIRSGRAKTRFVGERLQRLRDVVNQKLAAHGAIHISKDSGLFEAEGIAPQPIGH
jgi:ubiquinone/menaquinone biosynthesis C-methylase UbiE